MQHKLVASSNIKTVLFQVPNRVGLGHLNRMSCVALALRHASSKVRILFVIEGISHGLLELFDLPYILLPHSKYLLQESSWGPWPVTERCLFGSLMAGSILDVSDPSLIVYDCLPSMHFIENVIARCIPTVLCVRKMKHLDAYLKDPRVARVLQSDPNIIIPHRKSELYAPELMPRHPVYVGPIVRDLPEAPETVHARFGLHGRKVIVVSGGGGGHPNTAAYLNLCLRAFKHLRSLNRNAVLILITGPLFTSWDKLDLTENVRIVSFDPRFLETCATADLLICQAGYNTINEVAALGTPAICVPADRAFDDQFERAYGLSLIHSNITSFETGSINEFAALIERKLMSQDARVRPAAPDGAHRAAQHILKLLQLGSSKDEGNSSQAVL